MAEQIFFAYGGEVPQGIVLQLKGKNTLKSCIDGITHGGEYGGGKQGDELSCVVDGVRLALAGGGGLPLGLCCAEAVLAAENTV